MSTMRHLTFKRHNFDRTEPVSFRILPNDWPVDLDRPNTIRAAGFDPDNHRIGRLEAPWKGHPKYALVVANDSNQEPGSPFAVSNETFCPPK
jgi:hypothetical protein